MKRLKSIPVVIVFLLIALVIPALALSVPSIYGSNKKTQSISRQSKKAALFKKRAALKNESGFALLEKFKTLKINSVSKPVGLQVATRGTVSGVVTDTSGTPLRNIDVYAIGAKDGDWMYTDWLGRYESLGLAPGDYKLAFFDESGNYAYQFYNNKGSLAAADPVTIVAGQLTPNVNAQLDKAGFIVGVATDPKGKVVADVDGVVFNEAGLALPLWMENGLSGEYWVGGLRSGNYKLWIYPWWDDHLGDQFYNDKSDFKSAELINVIAGLATTGTDVALNYSPEVVIKTPKISTKISKTTRFRVSWSAKRPLPSSGIASYNIKYFVNGGEKPKKWRTGTKRKSGYFKGKEGKTYTFIAQATDNKGHVGWWSEPQKTIVPHDNNHLVSRRSGFSQTIKRRGSRYFRGSVRYSTRRGDRISYTFKGQQVTLIATRGRKYSKVRIKIDGKHAKKIDTYAKGRRLRRPVFTKTFDGYGKHTIEIINQATRGRPVMEIDALAVDRSDPYLFYFDDDGFLEDEVF